MSARRCQRGLPSFVSVSATNRSTTDRAMTPRWMRWCSAGHTRINGSNHIAAITLHIGGIVYMPRQGFCGLLKSKIFNLVNMCVAYMSIATPAGFPREPTRWHRATAQ